LRIGYELKFAEPHIGFLAGVAERTYAPVAHGGGGMYIVGGSSARFGLQVGSDFGTPYFRLTSWGDGSALTLPGRATFAVVLLFTQYSNRTNTNDVITSSSGPELRFSNSYGPNLAVDVTRHVTLYARVAVGWAIGPGQTLPTLDLDAFTGLRAIF